MILPTHIFLFTFTYLFQVLDTVVYFEPTIENYFLFNLLKESSYLNEEMNL